MSEETEQRLWGEVRSACAERDWERASQTLREADGIEADAREALQAYLARAIVVASDLPVVRLRTNHGDMFIALERERAPVTCANFERYVREGHYDGTLFHRVIRDFMIQGGGLNADFILKPTPRGPIENESHDGLENARGSVAMARASDPHSATSQFFINVVDNGFLDRERATDGWGYCVFGEVVAGVHVADAIAGVKTHMRGGHMDVPVDDVVILAAEFL